MTFFFFYNNFILKYLFFLKPLMIDEKKVLTEKNAMTDVTLDIYYEVDISKYTCKTE